MLAGANQAFVCTYSRQLNLTTSPISTSATSIDVIYAIGMHLVQGSADPQTAVIQQHTFTGSGSLAIVRQDGNSSSIPVPMAPSGTGSSSMSLADILARENLYNTLVEAHGTVNET